MTLTNIEFEILHSIIYRPNEATFKRIAGVFLHQFSYRHVSSVSNLLRNAHIPLLNIKNCMYRLTDKFRPPEVDPSRDR